MSSNRKSSARSSRSGSGDGVEWHGDPVRHSKQQSVFDRMTDHSQYTGIHKHRFDDEGKGRGKAGRETLIKVDGMTSSSKRDHHIEVSPSKNQRKGPVVKGKLGVQKFGVQAKKAAFVYLFRNGDKHDTGYRCPLKHVPDMRRLMEKASLNVKLVTGSVRKIYASDCRTRIRDINELEDGGRYLCCGGEKVASNDKLPEGFERYGRTPNPSPYAGERDLGASRV